MPRELPESDFRRLRRHLTNEDFAWAEGPEFEPKGNIDPDTWHGIMELPTDVAIRTTDFRGMDVRNAYLAASSWLHVYQELDNSPLHWQSSAVHEGFEASLFNAVSGWYRQAGFSLRVAIDDLLLGIYFQGQPDRWGEFREIVTRDRGSPKFACMREALFGLTGHSLFEYPGGAYGRLYDALSIYIHRIPDNVIWGSNGPIFENDGFNTWWKEYSQTDRLLKQAVKIALESLPWQRARIKRCRGHGTRQRQRS